MRLLLTGRQVEITSTLRRLVDARLAKLERRLGDALMSVQVVLSKEKNRFVAEIVTHARQDHILTGVGTAASWSASLTGAVKKVLQQAETVKGKWQQRKRSATSVRNLPPAVQVRAPRTRRRA
ncbi:MAG: ribosome-associated translation inhibitor RaiA [Acidobacteria bacterium]|nr:MAG: ribosome-associated translation inhibitor RaiA [Acidobacteriota bacterium]